MAITLLWKTQAVNRNTSLDLVDPSIALRSAMTIIILDTLQTWQAVLEYSAWVSSIYGPQLLRLCWVCSKFRQNSL